MVLDRPEASSTPASPDAQRWVWDDYTHRRPFPRKSWPPAVRRPGLRGRARQLRGDDPGSGRDRGL